MLDLHRRVEKILIGGAPPQAQEELLDSSHHLQDQNLNTPTTPSQLSLSPRSSLSSVSPPVSPYDPPLPPTYEQENTQKNH